MPLFLLTPKNLESEEWALSSHMCPVQVKADDPIQARYRAATHFDTGRSAAGLTRPWLKVDLASVQSIDEVDGLIPYIEAHAKVRPFRRGRRMTQPPVTPQEQGVQEPLPQWAQQPAR